MPFQSEKQRRYMHANLPDIAKRWERDYANGGIAELNAELNSLPEYYLQAKNQGGRIGYDKGLKVLPKIDITQSSSTPESGIDVTERDITYGGSGIYQGDKGYGGIDFQTGNVNVNVQKDGNTIFKDTMSKDDFYNLYVGLGEKEGYNVEVGTDTRGTYFLTIKTTFNQGGIVPSHEAGIYGLAEGGQLVSPSKTGERPGYQGWEPSGGAPQATESSSSGGSDRGPRDDPDRFGPTTTRTTGDGSTDRIVDIAERNRRQDLRDIITRGDEEKYDTWEQMVQDKYPGQGLTTKQPNFNIQKSKVILNKARDDWNAVKDSNNTWLKKKAGGKLVQLALTSGITFGLSDVIGGIVQGFKTSKAKNEFISDIKNQIENYRDLGIPEHSPHKDTLIQTLNQELLDLTQTRDRPDEDPDGEGGITYPSIARVNDQKEKEMEIASMRWRQEQKEVDRSKQMAYWRMMMQPYMSAQGGRVPGGYNTGGLSNLFRLKNV